MIRKTLALVLSLAALAASPWAHAQGYEVVPWPAHTPLPRLAGSDLQGKVWRLADLRGKAVLINFWASWCAPCQAEMPSLQALAQFYGPEKLVVLAVNFEESASVVRQHVQRTNFDLPVLLDPTGALAHQWGANVFPTTVLVAANDQVRGLVRGEMDWSSLRAAKLIEPLLAPSAK
ncbi:TlpA disulfide reductase family protein [Rhodoferax sp.]|uniref:TlpA family protein disulfide reductase n=1 Tax=Rhodoferax sp. TaxID=50421 RepID=UPI00284D4AA8|nr:TlpA disulfide reductase family protein [Rhodoferax sp.]MDR3371879.1 TlpA disulfide reductase family protein [Rhodoferax sp.]